MINFKLICFTFLFRLMKHKDKRVPTEKKRPDKSDSLPLKISHSIMHTSEHQLNKGNNKRDDLYTELRDSELSTNINSSNYQTLHGASTKDLEDPKQNPQTSTNVPSSIDNYNSLIMATSQAIASSDVSSRHLTTKKKKKSKAESVSSTELNNPSLNLKYNDTSKSNASSSKKISNQEIQRKPNEIRASPLEKNNNLLNTHTISIAGTEGTNEKQTKFMNIMKVEYMRKFASLSMCKKTDRLDKETLNHLENMKTRVEEKCINAIKSYNGSWIQEEHNAQANVKRVAIKNNNTTSNPTECHATLAKWGRKDISPHLKEAEKQRELIIQARSQDQLRDSIVELLNKITEDTYATQSIEIINLVKDNSEAQDKFLNSLFNRTLIGGNFSKYYGIYAQLCNDIETLEPNNNQEKKVDDDQPEESPFIKSLLKKMNSMCPTKIVHIDHEESNDDKLLQFRNGVLGYANFIIELSILDALDTTDYINSLLDRLENSYSYIHGVKILSVLQILIIEITFMEIETKVRYFEVIGNENDENNDNNDKDEKDDKLDNHESIKMTGKPAKNPDDTESLKQGKFSYEKSSFPNYIKFKMMHFHEIFKKMTMKYKLVDEKLLSQEVVEDSQVKVSSVDTKKCLVPYPEVCRGLKLEIFKYKDSLEEKGFKNWDISTNFYSKGINLSCMANAINDLSIDNVDCLKFAGAVCEYIEELFSYYKHELEPERKDFRLTTLKIALSLHDSLLDNKLMSMIVGQLLLTAHCHYNLRISDFDDFDISEDQATGIFFAFKSVLYQLKHQISKFAFKDAISKIKLIEKYRDLYESIVRNYI